MILYQGQHWQSLEHEYINFVSLYLKCFHNLNERDKRPKLEASLSCTLYLATNQDHVSFFPFAI